MKTILDDILEDVAAELAAAKSARPPVEIRSRLADAPPPRPFAAALGESFALIAEIKERSPSVGAMRPENVTASLGAYLESGIVHAVSVLTNATHFGMDIHRLEAVRSASHKPILRKDFLLEEYQIREARAFGADAVLLMANVLDAPRLRGFYDLARELGMEALFEVHEEEEIARLPRDARMIGINSRKFRSRSGFVTAGASSGKDFSLDFGAFALVDKLPPSTVKIAESGLSPETIARTSEVFHAGLVGTTLLRDPRGPAACLSAFEEALSSAATKSHPAKK